jgi:hypothetical protein
VIYFLPHPKSLPRFGAKNVAKLGRGWG